MTIQMNKMFKTLLTQINRYTFFACKENEKVSGFLNVIHLWALEITAGTFAMLLQN